MSSLIAGSSTDSIQSVINRALLAKKNAAKKNDSTEDEALRVKNTQSTSSSSVSSSPIGLYNNRGLLLVPEANKADEDLGAQDRAKNALVAQGGSVTVHISKSDLGSSDKIYWSSDNFKTSHYIASNKQAGSFDIGTFAPGTAIQFGIDDGSSKAVSLSAAASPLKQEDLISKNQVNIGLTDLNGGADNALINPLLTVTNVGIAQAKEPASETSSKGLKPDSATLTPAHFAKALGQSSSTSNSDTNPFLFGINTYSEGATIPSSTKIQVTNNTDKDNTPVANNERKTTDIYQESKKKKLEKAKSINIENKRAAEQVSDALTLNNAFVSQSNTPELFNQTLSGAKLKNQFSFQSNKASDTPPYKGLNDTPQTGGIGHSIHFKDITRHSISSIKNSFSGSDASGIYSELSKNNPSGAIVSSSKSNSAQELYSPAIQAPSAALIGYNNGATASTLDVKLLKALYLNQ